MYSFETTASSAHEIDLITNAFYRFLDTCALPEGVDASVHTEMLDAGRRCTVRLWSEDACEAFRRFLNRFELPAPMALAPQFGPTPSA